MSESNPTSPSSNPPDHLPLTSFTCFDRLPLELRDLIWRYAVPGPRVITITQSIGRSPAGVCEYCHKREECHIGKLGLPIDSSPITEPLLSTCQESRHIAKQYYHLGPIIEDINPNDICPVKKPGRFLYKPNIDVVWWHQDGGFQNLYPVAAFIVGPNTIDAIVPMPSMKRVAVDYSFVGQFIALSQTNIYENSEGKIMCPNVRDLAIVMRNDSFDVAAMFHEMEAVRDTIEEKRPMPTPEYISITKDKLAAWAKGELPGGRPIWPRSIRNIGQQERAEQAKKWRDSVMKGRERKK